MKAAELNRRSKSRRNRYVLSTMAATLFVGLLFWGVDSLVHYLSQGALTDAASVTYTSLLDALIFQAPKQDLISRGVLLTASLLCGGIAVLFIRKYHASEQRYRLLFESMPVGVAIATPEAHILSCNEELLETLRCSSIEDVQDNLHHILDADTLKRLETLWRRHHKLETVLNDARRQDGTTCALRITAQPVFSQDEGAILVIVQDVTDHAEAMEALRESQETYRALAENTTDVIMRFDRRFQYRYVNPAVQQLFNQKPDRFIGQTPRKIGFPDSLCTFWEKRIQLVFDEGTPRNETFVYRNGNHTTFVEWRLVPEFSAQGEVDTVLTTARDVTERKQAEEQAAHERIALAEKFKARTAELQMANAELARAARLKDEFLANMSHELRTPLTVILTFTEILRSGLYGTLDERQDKPLSAIEESGKHLLSLITDILDVSKIEAGKLALDFSSVDVEGVAQASIQLIEPQAKKKQLTVQLSFDPTVTQIRADERRLKQILVNLLGNSVKFTPSEGTMGLDVVGDGETQTVQFVVWDTGIGIAEEDMGRLFQPFIQLDSSLTRKYQGTGLGLALVRRLTELHYGTIAVESEVGVGSRFIVSLPWVEVAEEESERDEASSLFSSQPASQAQVLLVEDNQAAVRPVRKFLKAQGYDVIEARDGAEAIRRAIEDLPDVILMDIQMPVMDGFEATRRIRANNQTHDIPVIALTALAMPGDQERCLEAGANAYISKPLRLADLAEMIERQLQTAPRSERWRR